ncbi:MAG TPA: hypothetical protein PKH39_19845 [Woeseiaceae bacterium]|nr:hypothetical protein [Woeseiaceae bacterium]
MRLLATRITLVVVLLLSGQTAFAQFGFPSETNEPFGFEDRPTWNMSFTNYNVWENDTFYDRIDNHFYFADGANEPIDEIIVRAKRRAARRMFLGELYAQMDWFAYSQLSYAQQSECQMIANIDPGTSCTSEPETSNCITTTYTVSALSQGQADELNITYSEIQDIDNASSSLQVGVLAALFTGGMSANASVLTSLLATAGSFASGMPDRNNINPFAAGDSFEMTMVTCSSSDGFSGPNSSVTVNYTGG